MVSALFYLLTFETVTIEADEAFWANSEKAFHGTQFLDVCKSPGSNFLDDPWSARTSWANFEFNIPPTAYPDNRLWAGYFVFWLAPNQAPLTDTTLGVDGEWPLQRPVKDSKRDRQQISAALKLPGILQIVDIQAVNANSPTQIIAKFDSFGFNFLYNVASNRERFLEFYYRGNHEKLPEPIQFIPWSGHLELSVKISPNSANQQSYKIYSLTADPKYRPQIKLVFKRNGKL